MRDSTESYGAFLALLGIKHSSRLSHWRDVDRILRVVTESTDPREVVRELGMEEEVVLYRQDGLPPWGNPVEEEVMSYN